MRTALLFFPLALAGCASGRSGGAACGLTAIAGATMLLQEFATPNQTLSVPPHRLPPRLVARVAAGPAFDAVVGRTSDSALLIGVNGTIPASITPRFGVLVVDPGNTTRGVVIYESDPVRGAPVLGKLSIDTLVLPLLGIQLDPARVEDARCPLFPDSVLR